MLYKRAFSSWTRFGLLTTGLLAATLTAFAGTPTGLCQKKGFSILLFNGVWNTPRQAKLGLAVIGTIRGESFKDEPIKYDVFYNSTGCIKSNPRNASCLEDISEVFIQRAAEIDSTGELSKRIEYFWDSLRGNKSLIQKSLNLIPSLDNVVSALYTQVTASVAAATARMVSNPPTAADYAEHRVRMDSLAVEGQKIVMVAHSQGNLFVNPAYDYVVPKIGPSAVGVIHIAPASPTLRGEHILADIDIVINGLRVQGVSSVPPVTINLPTSTADVSGHELAGTYLDTKRAALPTIDSMFVSLMNRLTSPVTRGNVGSFTVTMQWNGSGDVDLHTFEPAGAHVYWLNKRGQAGELDVDNVVRDGPEHYYASCDVESLQLGTYQVGVNNYSSATGRTASIQVSTPRDGILLTRSVDVGPERGSNGDASPILVLTVTVSRDQTSGRYSVAAR